MVFNAVADHRLMPMFLRSKASSLIVYVHHCPALIVQNTNSVLIYGVERVAFTVISPSAAMFVQRCSPPPLQADNRITSSSASLSIAGSAFPRFSALFRIP